MPGPHHHHHHADKWWEELSESAKNAAAVMGYDETTWDEGEQVAYHSKDFSELSSDEKRAAVFLGRDPLDYKLKNVMWGDISDETKEQAQVLGWDEEKWDESWTTHDVECKYKWDEASSEAQKALEYFGYNKNLWDRLGEDESFGASAVSDDTFLVRYLFAVPTPACWRIVGSILNF